MINATLDLIVPVNSKSISKWRRNFCLRFAFYNDLQAIDRILEIMEKYGENSIVIFYLHNQLAFIARIL